MSSTMRSLQDRIKAARERLIFIKKKEEEDLQKVLKNRKYRITLFLSIIYLTFISVFLSDWYMEGNYVPDKIVSVSKKTYHAPGLRGSGVHDKFWIIEFENHTTLQIAHSKYIHQPKAGDGVQIEKSWLLQQPKSMLLDEWREIMIVESGIFSFEKLGLYFLTLFSCLVLLLYSNSGFKFLSDFVFILVLFSIGVIIYSVLKYS